MSSSNGNISALQALCERNPSVTLGFPSQRPAPRSFAVFFDLQLNKRLSKQPIRWCFETPWHSLWRHCSVAKPSLTFLCGWLISSHPLILVWLLTYFCPNILAWCRIYASWKTALISRMTHICVANPSISLIGPGGRPTKQCQAKIIKNPPVLSKTKRTCVICPCS